jgi:hypothetical protein
MAASIQASEKIGSTHLFASYDHDPDSASATITTPDAGTTKRSLDMGLYSNFAVLVNNQALTGAGVTKVEIVAADDSAMATNLTQIKDSGTIAVTNLDKYALIECSAEEVAQASAAGGFSLRYVAARITVANSADEARVIYIALPKQPHRATTAALT